MATAARVVLDSISPSGSRLTTLEVTFHRFVLAEFNTHRVFSRNSASSRAIPVDKQLAFVITDPAMPIEWPREQPGMQGGSELTGEALWEAEELFDDVWTYTFKRIERYLKDHPDKSDRLHKSLVNRLLEPFMWHTVIVTSADWDGFFHQRCSELAQPEIRKAAVCMRKACEASEPRELEMGEWHTPYIQPDEIFIPSEARRVSAARCARVSYLTHDGLRDPSADLALFDRLVQADPPHASPLEHVATPANISDTAAGDVLGNFRTWHQLRHLLPRFT